MCVRDLLLSLRIPLLLPLPLCKMPVAIEAERWKSDRLWPVSRLQLHLPGWAAWPCWCAYLLRLAIVAIMAAMLDMLEPRLIVSAGLFLRLSLDGTTIFLIYKNKLLYYFSAKSTTHLYKKLWNLIPFKGRLQGHLPDVVDTQRGVYEASYFVILAIVAILAVINETQKPMLSISAGLVFREILLGRQFYSRVLSFYKLSKTAPLLLWPFEHRR